MCSSDLCILILFFLQFSSFFFLRSQISDLHHTLKTSPAFCILSHSSFPGAGPVPILLSLLFLFLLPYPSTGGVSCLLGGLRSSASVQWVFCRSSSTCRCISDVFVGRKVISASYSSAILKVSSWLNLSVSHFGLLRQS